MSKIWFLLIAFAVFIGCDQWTRQTHKVLSPTQRLHTEVTCHTFFEMPFVCIEKQHLETDIHIVETVYVEVEKVVEVIVEKIVIKEKLKSVPIDLIVQKVLYILEQRAVPPTIEETVQEVIEVVEETLPEADVVETDDGPYIQEVVEEIYDYTTTEPTEQPSVPVETTITETTSEPTVSEPTVSEPTVVEYVAPEPTAEHGRDNFGDPIKPPTLVTVGDQHKHVNIEEPTQLSKPATSVNVGAKDHTVKSNPDDTREWHFHPKEAPYPHFWKETDDGVWVYSNKNDPDAQRGTAHAH